MQTNQQSNHRRRERKVSQDCRAQGHTLQDKFFEIIFLIITKYNTYKHKINYRLIIEY